MAIIVTFNPTGMNGTKYDEVMKRLDAAGAGAPDGRLSHVCFGPENSLRVVDVYDTPQNFEKFGQTLVPMLAQLGISGRSAQHGQGLAAPCPSGRGRGRCEPRLGRSPRDTRRRQANKKRQFFASLYRIERHPRAMLG